ncbi:hypothetical protein [Streptomyces sp. NPDC001089]
MEFNPDQFGHFDPPLTGPGDHRLHPLNTGQTGAPGTPWAGMPAPGPGPNQRAFRGFGDQAMRHYRATPPTPPSTPSPAPAPTPASGGWTQPQLPDPPAATPTPSTPGSQPGMGRLSSAAQARADIAAARAQARAARVATAQANAQAATHRQALAQHRASQAHQRVQAATNPPTPPAPPAPGTVPDNTPPGPPSTPNGPGRSTTINSLSYRSSSLRFGPPPQPPDPPSGAGRTSMPSRPAAPPLTPAPTGRASRVPPGTARAAKYAGAGVFVAAKALQSISRPATDPKRSGNPLYKTNQGWMR